MDFSEFTGLLISLFAFIVLIYRKIKDERLRRQHPEMAEESEKEQKQRLKEFLKSLDIDEEEEPESYKPPPPPLPKPQPPKPKKAPSPAESSYQFASKLDAFKQKNAIETRQYDPYLEKKFKEASIVSSRYKDSTGYEIIETRKAPSRAKKIIGSLKSKKEMVLLFEIFNRPISDR